MTMESYVIQTYGSWSEEYQDRYFREEFDTAKVQVIQLGEKAIGQICIEKRRDCLFLSKIEIIPEYQGQGIGTQVLKDVLARAAAEQVPVRLQVFKVNPARALYERLGFSADGETDTHVLMLYRATHQLS